MGINADLRARVVLDTESMAWLAMAGAGAWRKPLDRNDGAAAGETGLVKGAPGCSFDPPVQGVGEEILVLTGELADGEARYSVGTYLRNPPGVHRTLRTDQGCMLFVKRYPFEPTDSAVVRIDTANTPWLPGRVPGLGVMPLHAHQHEHAALVRWAPETHFQPHGHFGGEEILVVSGVFEDEHGSYPAGTWIRSPHGSRHQPFSRLGCTIYVKTGHLPVTDGHAG
ncbi:MAG: cupin domain-containing protein [Hydrogenophilales bacterium]|nr:cupin domain-containing protein [Hydrogenophilales bacterium]